MYPQHREDNALAIEDGAHLAVGEALRPGLVVVRHPHRDAGVAVRAGGAHTLSEGRRPDGAKAEDEVVRSQHQRSPT